MSLCDVTGGLASSSHTFQASVPPAVSPRQEAGSGREGCCLWHRGGDLPPAGWRKGHLQGTWQSCCPCCSSVSSCMVATEAPFSSRQCPSLCPLDTPARQGLSYLLVRSRGSEGQVVTDSFGFNPRPASPELCRQIGPCPPVTPLLSPPPLALLLSSRARSLQGSVQAQQGVARPAEAKVGRPKPSPGLGQGQPAEWWQAAFTMWVPARWVPSRPGMLSVGLAGLACPWGSGDPGCLVAARVEHSGLGHTHDCPRR